MKIGLDGELGSRARRPQAFRGVTRKGSRENPRDQGSCRLESKGLDEMWLGWHHNAETYVAHLE